MRILFLSAWHPYPPDNGSKLRIFNILCELAKHHEITLLSFADNPQLAKVHELEAICKSVHVLPKKDYDAGSNRAVLGFFGKKPRVLADRFVPEMDQMIRKEISNGDHDLVIASQIYMADYLDYEFNIPAIFEEVEIGVFIDAVQDAGNLISKTRRQLTLSKLQSYFHTLLPNFTFTTVVSEMEKDLVQDLVPEYQAVEVIPNGVSIASYQEVSEQPQPGQLIFTGALTYAPNYHAMQWFAGQVLPLVNEVDPNVQLIITGDHASIQLDNSQNVNLVGYVEDIRPLIASSWISIAPIFSGGGTRLKILEAFGLQTPVIATSKGAEGLDVQHEKHLLIADTVESFAQETIRLLNDVELRHELVSNAFKLVLEKYDWSVIMPKFLSLVDSAVESKNKFL